MHAMDSTGCMQADVHLSTTSVTLSGMQVEEGVGYPKPVRDILEAAGVLDAVPYSPEPVLAGASKVPLPRPLSYEWSDEGACRSAEFLGLSCACQCAHSLRHQTQNALTTEWNVVFLSTLKGRCMVRGPPAVRATSSR